MTDNGRKKLPPVSERMRMVADMVTGGTACDIGCDHGYVSIYLYLTGKATSCIAADIRKGPLEAAGKNIILYGAQEGVETRLGSGLKVIKPAEADSVIISGMGGNTILSILKESPETAKSAKELILEPQSEFAEVRNYLTETGFFIADEKMVCEEGKYYPVIKAVPSLKEVRLKKEELEFGPCLLKNQDKILKEFLNGKKTWLQKMTDELKNNSGPKAALRYKELTDEMITVCEGLKYYG